MIDIVNTDPTGRELTGLRLFDRDAWAKIVARTMKKHGGALDDAAKELEVSWRTLARWLAELPDVPRRAPGKPATKVKR